MNNNKTIEMFNNGKLIDYRITCETDRSYCVTECRLTEDGFYRVGYRFFSKVSDKHSFGKVYGNKWKTQRDALKSFEFNN